MTVALRLAQRGHDVTLLESAPATGGLASPESIGDVTWDRFYHVMLLSDSHLVGLLDELGLAHKAHWRETRTGFYGDGRLHEMSSSLDFARFPLLSFAEKARLAATILHASRVRRAFSSRPRCARAVRHAFSPRGSLPGHSSRLRQK